MAEDEKKTPDEAPRSNPAAMLEELRASGAFGTGGSNPYQGYMDLHAPPPIAKTQDEQDDNTGEDTEDPTDK